ncbi:hypothetical protein REH81_04135 [Vibrio rotiferianus]
MGSAMMNVEAKYLVFCGEDFEQTGGAKDFLIGKDSIFEATEIALAVIGKQIFRNEMTTFTVEWSHVLDVKNGKIIQAFECAKDTPKMGVETEPDKMGVHSVDGQLLSVWLESIRQENV